MASRRNGFHGSRQSDPTLQNGMRSGYGHSYHQTVMGSNGTAVNGSGPANNDRGRLYDASSNFYYGNGGPFRSDNETDRSSEISEGSEDFMGNYGYQPWMDKITGGTFRKDYLDRISFRPSLKHDSTIPMQQLPNFRHDDNHNINAHAHDPSVHPEVKCSKALKKVLIAIVVILFLGGIAGVLAWYFTLKGDEDISFNYYVVSSEMALSSEYHPELADSSSQEFKNLSKRFCDAISVALQKNSTEYGDRYKQCDVTAFRNGSIIVLYKLFYVYLEVQITKEKVHKDLNNSLTNVDSERATLSDFVIIKASVKFIVEVQTFQTDPLAQPVISTTELPQTTTTQIITQEATTAPPATSITSAESTTEATSKIAETTTKATSKITEATTEATSTIAEAITSTRAEVTIAMTGATTTTMVDATTEATSTIAEATSTIAEVPTTAKATTGAEATSTSSSSAIPTPTMGTTTTAATSTLTTMEAISYSTTTEATLTTAEVTSTTKKAEATSKSEKTTVQSTQATFTTEDTTRSIPSAHTSDPTTESTKATLTTEPSTKRSTTMDTTEKSTTSTTMDTPEMSTTSTTMGTTEMSTISKTMDTPEMSTTSTTMDTTEMSITSTTMGTTEMSTTSTTIGTTEMSTTSKTMETPELSQTSTTMDTTEMSSTSTTMDITEMSTTSTTMDTTEMSTTSTTIYAPESSPTPTAVDTTESSTSTTMDTTVRSSLLTTASSTISTIGTTEGSRSTTMVTTTISEQYTADVVVGPIIAIYGETATRKICVVTPHGAWDHVTVTLENQGTPYVIGKYHRNKIYEEPASQERFNATVYSTNTDIEVYLTLDLQAPTTDMCSWDGKYTFSCSVTMNDTIPTRVNNGSQIFITAPLYEVTIDSNVHYNEGDKMTFNCSTKGDPNYSSAYAELIKDSTVFETFPGPDFSMAYNNTDSNKNSSNCLIDSYWSGFSEGPLTTNHSGVIVRCVVKNSLLNENKTSEKRLNVSFVESTKTSTTMGTTERSTISTEVDTTESSKSTTTDTVESSTASTTMDTTGHSTASTVVDTTDSSTISTTMGTTETSTTSTTMDTTEISTTTVTTPLIPVEYSADVVIAPLIAIYGERTTTEVCVLTPHGNWLHATTTVEYQGMQHVIGKIHRNNTFEGPASLERFDISMLSKNMDIAVNLIMNLTTPVADACSLDGKYTFTCSITMNDTVQTVVSNGSQIFITAPMSEISIDSEVHYNEGEKMAFNCSLKEDPNYSIAYLELIRSSNILQKIQGPMFGSDYNSNCSVVLNWSGENPNPLTTQEDGLIVRCVVKNNLLNETRISEKKLNVSAADVAFTRYFYRPLTKTHQEIVCIARSPMSILHELMISKDNVQIAVLNSSGVASSSPDGRYSTNQQSYDGTVRLTLGISSVECQDQGIYSCMLITTNNETRVSTEMTFRVEGSKPTMTLHPDIYEPFARLGFNHICTTEHIGDENNDNFLEIQIFKPGSQRVFTYSKKTAEVDKMFDSTNNITYINMTGTTAQFLLVSHTSSSSNQSCNNKETISFLMDLTMEYDNGTIKCVLKDEMEEFSAVESTLTVIPGNFCVGYKHGAFRKHPNNDCNYYVNCNEIEGKMYATGNRCPLGYCILLNNGQCLPCDATFTCEELTTPGPTTTTTTLPPGTRYVSCNDSAHFLGTTAVIRCVILDTSFDSLNITFLPEQSQNEEYLGEIFPDGQTISPSQSPVDLSTTYAPSTKTIIFTFQSLECSSRGRYRIIATGTNSSVAPSVETFKLNVIGNLTKFELHVEPTYPEGASVEFNCTAFLDESHANIKGYYKKESGSSFSEIKGSTTVIERNASHCFVKALWKPSTPFTADTSFNNADLKCKLVDWPFIQRTKKISIKNADVAFETYKLESVIGSQVSVKCLARNTNSIKTILIRKIENSVNHTVANVTLPDKASHVGGMTVSYTNDSMTLTFSALTCSDDGYYTCIVIKEDGSQLESPAYLHVQIKNPPKHEAVTLTLNPDIKENRYDTSNVHTCSGDVGYPVGLGYLSLRFTHPITNASFTYDNLTVTENMKTSLNPPLKFQVGLANGLSIIIVEDGEPDTVNCTRNKEIKFLLQATRDWNKAYIRCSVISETGEVNGTSVEEEMYVIPDAICNGSNGSDVYVPHEKIDSCKTYVRCFNNIPTGQTCRKDLCFDHQKKNLCDWCRDVSCESEMSPTTEEEITTISSTPAVPETQCPLISCNPASVFETETGYIICELNISMAYENITMMKSSQPIMTIYPNGTSYYFSDNVDKYESTVGTSVTFGIKNVSCSDQNEYTFTVQVGDGGSCSKTVSLDIKANPRKPTLVIDYRWTEGTNSGTHSCVGDIGNPPGTMTLEIKNGETGNFTSFSPSSQTFSQKMEDCNNEATLSFSIDFKTNDIAGYYIRCAAVNNHLSSSSSESTFYSDEIRISPLPKNACIEDGVKPYPGECTRYLNCANNITHVSQCGAGLCFSVSTCINTNCDTICT